MREFPSYWRSFADFGVTEAVYRTSEKEEEILLEFRGSANEEEMLFTIIDGRPIRVGSIHQLVSSLPELVSLTIEHSIRVVWEGQVKRAQLTEIFTHSQANDSVQPPNVRPASLQLRLVVDGKTYETTVSDSFSDLVQELKELTEGEGKWRLRTCRDCRYAGQPHLYSASEREYWCYRDVPEAIADLEVNVKFANMKARFEGRYFVRAFHTCAAWQPWNPVPTPNAEP